MLWLLRMVMAVAVAVIPGAFVLLLTYVTARTLLRQWRQAQVQAQLSGGVPVPLREVLATVELRALVREARATL
jgi:hypothetical protein